MDRFYIVTNDGKDVDFHVTDRVREQLENAGKVCYLCEKDDNKKIIQKTIPDNIDCAIVIGGDGTLIAAARSLYGRNIPILGINMGTLGYLTEVELSNLETEIGRLIRGEFSLEKRMMLDGSWGDEKRDVALNDIVVTRRGALRVIHFKLYVNGELLNSYEADGIIISTPTGSTAYNLSAGGPIVEPTAELLVITPICSHTLNTSSIVLSAEDELVVEIGKGRNGTTEEVYAAFDGSDMVLLKTGDSLIIQKSKSKTNIVKLSKMSFLEILRKKMKGK